MSEAAVGYERREIVISEAGVPGRASDFWSFLHGRRIWRNTAVAVVAIAAAANAGLLIITAGW
ncbi:MAG: hypothetical protein R3E88_22210 [Myxococcota bacterium]|nr:hypothetical protein [Myxococcales bacterium]